jgi:hypothetical protein
MQLVITHSYETLFPSSDKAVRPQSHTTKLTRKQSSTKCSWIHNIWFHQNRLGLCGLGVARPSCAVRGDGVGAGFELCYSERTPNPATGHLVQHTSTSTWNARQNRTKTPELWHGRRFCILSSNVCKLQHV